MLTRHLRELRLEIREGLTVSPTLPVQARGQQASAGVRQLRLQQSRGSGTDSVTEKLNMGELSINKPVNLEITFTIRNRSSKFSEEES